METLQPTQPYEIRAKTLTRLEEMMVNANFNFLLSEKEKKVVHDLHTVVAADYDYPVTMQQYNVILDIYIRFRCQAKRFQGETEG